MAIIGIGLGTTNSLACVYRNGKAELIPNELGEYLTSSAVSVLEDGSVLVGRQRNYEWIKERLDRLEALIEADALAILLSIYF